MAIKRLTAQQSNTDAKVDALIEKLKAKNVITASDASDVTSSKGKKG